jgi:hypothetical protein
MDGFNPNLGSFRRKSLIWFNRESIRSIPLWASLALPFHSRHCSWSTSSTILPSPPPGPTGHWKGRDLVPQVQNDIVLGDLWRLPERGASDGTTYELAPGRHETLLFVVTEVSSGSVAGQTASACLNAAAAVRGCGLATQVVHPQGAASTAPSHTAGRTPHRCDHGTAKAAPIAPPR